MRCHIFLTLLGTLDIQESSRMGLTSPPSQKGPVGSSVGRAIGLVHASPETQDVSFSVLTLTGSRGHRQASVHPMAASKPN